MGKGRFVIPARVRITPKVSYEVLYTDAFDEENLVGLTRYKERQIIIKTGEPAADTLKTFFHELMHAVSHEYRADISHKSIYKLENAVFNILALNEFTK